jgi:hypothetical protein
VGEDVLGGFADGEEVFLCPALLQADNVGRRVEGGDLAADFCEAGTAVFGDVFEAPAVEGEDAQVGGQVEDAAGGGWERMHPSRCFDHGRRVCGYMYTARQPWNSYLYMYVYQWH